MEEALDILAGPAMDPRLLADPRHLVPPCAECRHRTEAGLCGLGHHPVDEWARPGGCPDHSPIDLGGGGDGDPDDAIEF